MAHFFRPDRQDAASDIIAFFGIVFAAGLVLVLAPVSGSAQNEKAKEQSAAAPSPFGALDLSPPGKALPSARLPALVGKPMPANDDAEPTAPPAAADLTPSTKPATDQQTGDVPPPLPPEEAARLKTKARAALQEGDVVAARALLNAVAVHRDPEAAFLLAQTYDTRMLSQWGAIGVEANQDKASWFYDRARQDGYTPEPDTTGTAEVHRAGHP